MCQHHAFMYITGASNTPKAMHRDLESAIDGDTIDRPHWLCYAMQASTFEDALHDLGLHSGVIVIVLLALKGIAAAEHGE